MKSIKKLLFVAVSALTFTANVFAQAPAKFSYQAVVRDNAGGLLTNDALGMRISVLQGSIGGPSVYTETHTPTTNANGLVSLEVGTGTVVSGNFSTIDWANGPYFIKAETDPTGGTSYTITGTSQLTTVPYAFYAAVADSLTGYMPVDSTTIADMGYVAGIKTYEVGDFAHGGVVFWVDETKQHGLVCTKTDIGPGTRWNAQGGTYGATRAVGDGAYGGAMNTVLIIMTQMAIGDDGNPFAASVCSDLVITEDGVIYGDWYLPTVDEMEMIGDVYTIVDATATANGGTALIVNPYWTSVELNDTNAKYVVITPGGNVLGDASKDAPFLIRAVRAF